MFTDVNALLTPLAFGLAVTAFVVQVWPHTGADARRSRTIVGASLVASTLTVLAVKVDLSSRLLLALSILFLAVTLLHALRTRSRQSLTSSKLRIFTLADFAVGSIALTLTALFSVAFSRPTRLSWGTVCAFPALYAILTAYALYNIAVMQPARLELAAWRIVSYAFPEGTHYRRPFSDHGSYNELPFRHLIGWTLFVLAAMFGLLVGFWVLGRPVVTMSYLIVALVAGTIWGIRHGFVAQSGKGGNAVAHNIVVGSALIALVEILLIALLRGTPLKNTTSVERLILGSGIAMPLLLAAVQVLPSLPDRIISTLRHRAREVRAWVALCAVAESAKDATFRRNSVQALRALVLGAVLVLYLVIPRIDGIMSALGLRELGGHPVSELVAVLSTTPADNLSSTDPNNRGFATFVFSNNGLVLLFLAWCAATLLAWADMPLRLERVPFLCKSWFGRVVPIGLLILFYVYFLPFIAAFSLAVPVVGTSFLGPSMEILFGAFTFALLLPTIEAYALAPVYLIWAVANTRPARDALHLNSAKEEDLCRLPGVGVKLARRIASSRPFHSMKEFEASLRLPSHMLRRIQPLVRLEP